MNEFEPNIDAKLNSLFDQLIRRAEKGQAINVQPWIFWLSFDTVCRCSPSTPLRGGLANDVKRPSSIRERSCDFDLGKREPVADIFPSVEANFYICKT